MHSLAKQKGGELETALNSIQVAFYHERQSAQKETDALTRELKELQLRVLGNEGFFLSMCQQLEQVLSKVSANGQSTFA